MTVRVMGAPVMVERLSYFEAWCGWAVVPGEGSKNNRTRRDPQRGQRNRSASSVSGMSLPRVHTSVFMLSSALSTHSRIDFMPSRLPQAQRTRTRHPASHASPNVEIMIAR